MHNERPDFPQTNTPAVSIIMAVYNGERYVRQATESILEQTLHDFEFIIIDDGSTDGTANILREFSDERIRIITNERNEGLTRCLIRGCNEARGKYIARMDADDVSHAERLEEEVAFLDAHPDHVVAGCCYCAIDPDGFVIKHVSYPLRHEEIIQFMSNSNSFAHGAVLFRADAYRRAGGYRVFFRFTQDYDLWLRMSEQGKLSNLPDFLYQHRHHHRKIALTNVCAQKQFAHLARRLAEERIGSRVDSLTKEDFATVNKFLDEARPKGFLKRQAMISQYYADFAKSYEKLKMKHLSRLLAASFFNNPFNGTLWKFILSAKFRRRLREGFGRKVREATREGG